MPSYAPSLKTKRMQAVIDEIDGALEPGFMEIGTVGVAVVMITITLDSPSFVEGSGAITMSGTPKWGTVLVDGKSVEARIRDGDGKIIVSGLTVGLTSGYDIILDAVDLIVDQTVTLSQARIVHSP